jgi:hypothetical protein
MMKHPLVYLDSSTFADAFDAVHVRKPTGGDPYEKLYILIGKISTEASLCYSTTHVEEILEWDPYERVLAMAEWIDGLHPVWTRSADRALDGELEWWLRRELGLATTKEYCPFSISFTGVIGPPNLSQAVSLLRNPASVAGIVRQCHGRRDELPDVKAASVDGFRRLHLDRSSLSPDISAEAIARRGASKAARDVELRACQLWPTLVPDRAGLLQDDVVAAARALGARPDALPVSRLWQHVVSEICKSITAQDRDSQAFLRRYRSAAHDHTHLTGAAYCDVFTCDKRVDDAIGSFRTDRGMLPQLSVRGVGGPEQFVRLLGEQVTAAARNASSVESSRQ